MSPFLLRPNRVVFFFFLAGVLLWPHPSPAQEPAREEPLLLVVERGADYRVMEWHQPGLDPDGQPTTYTNRYTELQTGLHFWDEAGQLQDTVAEFVPVSDGFIAARGPHQVALATELTTPGAITVVTAEGQTLRSNPTLLAYVDRATGQSVRLADLQPCTGEQVEPGTVLYRNAFDSIRADVRAVYTASGFECDVIIRQALPHPSLFGLNPETTDVEVFSEFFGLQPSAIRERWVPVNEAESAVDVDLHFGPMVLGRGRAFVLGADLPEIPVRKSWERREERDFLIERTAWRDLEPLLRELPEASVPAPTQRRWQERVRRTAQVELPARSGELYSWPRSGSGRLRVPEAVLPEVVFHASDTALPGVVLDYVVVNSTANQTFDSLTTYFVSGSVQLTGAVKFMPGTVLKYTNGASLKVMAGATIDWQGAPYRPITLTAYHDNAAGEALPYATGSPSGTYASTALSLDGTGLGTPLVLSNLVIRHAATGLVGIYFSPSIPLTVRHAQLVQCGNAFRFQFGTTADAYFVQNALVYSTLSGNTVFKELYNAKVAGSFLTVNGASQLFQTTYNPHYSTVSLANSVLVNVGSTSGVSLANSGTPPASTLVTAGAGAHYFNLAVPAVAAWFDVRPPNPAPGSPLAEELAQATVRAPALLPPSIATEVVLFPSLPVPRIGYHYWPIHYLTAGVTVNGTTLTLTNGVVVAGTSNTGFTLGAAAEFRSRGRPEALSRFCWASAVQELPTGTASPPSRRFLTVGSSGATSPPTVDLRFLRVELNADSSNRRWFQEEISTTPLGSFRVRDSQLFGARLSFGTNYISQSITLDNSLWVRGDFVITSMPSDARTLSIRQNLFQAGTFYSGPPGSASAWTVRENFFDGVTLTGWFSPGMTTGYNAYSAASAWFGGSNNKVSIVAAYQNGPLGGYYYPATGGSTTLNALRNVGSRSAGAAQLFHHTTQVNQAKDGEDNPSKVDIGFHYAVLHNGAELDSDQDGLPDSLEDLDGDGVQDAGETHWSNADSDGDGVLDGEERAAFTNPLDKNSWIPKRLAAWWWDATGEAWRLGDQGQSPITNGNSTQVVGITNYAAATQGVQMITSTNGPLRYRVSEDTGRPNLRLDQGSVRLWFKPNWSLATNPPTWSAPLIEVGKYNDDTLGWWSWYLHFDTSGGSNQFWVKFGQGANGHFPASRFQSRLKLTDWGSPAQWHKLVLSYDTEVTRLFHNGAVNSWVDSQSNIWDHGVGVTNTLMPTTNGLAHGIHLGADYTGSLAVNGTFDSIETFNYPLRGMETFRHQQLTLNIVTNAGQRKLQFTRSYQGSPTNISFGYSLIPWPVTLWRRTLGTSTNWGAPILSNSTAESWIDSAVSPGIRYQYLAEFASAGGSSRRHFLAGIEMPPQHQRGNVLLLVDQTLASSLTTELAQLRTNLVGDGWTVKHWYNAPRHNDLNFAANRPNLTNVVNWIAANHVAGVSNVIFIIGHVTIPYSGIATDDGHGDHQGAWVCDAYYGYLDKTPWTDVINAPGNAPNDGKFDQDVLPGPVDLPVGRVDFARMTVFAGLTEAQLIQRYLEKDSRYRTHGIPTFGRVSYYAAHNPDYALRPAQALAGASFGLTPGTAFSGANLRHQVPADLGVHFSNGSEDDIAIFDDRWVSFNSTNFANVNKEVPVTFRHVWASYMCDWARLDPTNSTFTINNNWLRASLGWPNHGLATVGGPFWDLSPLGGGAPLADSMKLGWDGIPNIRRFHSILGDPTLRLHRVTPPRGVNATRTSSTATVTWLPSPDPDCHYYVYRSTGGLSGTPTLLNSGVPIHNLTYTDTGSSAGALYQVRACRLQVTGSGSYWNLSQGAFMTVP